MALVLDDLEEQRFLSLMLCAIGIQAVEYKMNDVEVIKERAVIVDELLIPPYHRKVQEEKIIVLNWKAWKKNNPLSQDSGNYHISSLRRWMSEELLQNSQKMKMAM